MRADQAQARRRFDVTHPFKVVRGSGAVRVEGAGKHQLVLAADLHRTRCEFGHRH